MTVSLAELRQRRKAASPRPLHVVVLPYPAKGHSIPLLHFAKRLHGMGVVVTFVNTFSHLAREHFRTLDGLDISAIRVVPLGVPPAEGEGEGGLPYAKHVNGLVSEAEAMVAELFAGKDDDSDAPAPDCIVSDMFLGWTQIVADKFQIPRYVLFASPAPALATMLHMPELTRQGLLPIDPANKEEFVYDIPGVPPTRLADLPSPMQDANSFIYPFYAKNCDDLHEAKGVLLNSYYELEPSYVDTLRRTVYGNDHGQAGHSLSILPVGPLLPKAFFSGSASESASAIQDPCIQFLDTQPASSVLYVSFGSVAVLSVAQIHELARGLEASGERFLLILRPPHNPDNVALLPEGFEARTKGRGLVHVGWAPQLYVLSHQAVAGFLSHCGWNSTLESICRGVPMLTWPIQAEQAMNARFLVDDVKTAIEVCTVTDEFVTKEQISKAVRSLMSEPEGVVAKSNARKLQQLALAAVEEGGSVQRHLEEFLEELRS